MMFLWATYWLLLHMCFHKALHRATTQHPTLSQILKQKKVISPFSAKPKGSVRNWALRFVGVHLSVWSPLELHLSPLGVAPLDKWLRSLRQVKTSINSFTHVWQQNHPLSPKFNHPQTNYPNRPSTTRSVSTPGSKLYCWASAGSALAGSEQVCSGQVGWVDWSL